LDDDNESKHKTLLLARCDEQMKHLNRQALEVRMLRHQIETKDQHTATWTTPFSQSPNQTVVDTNHVTYDTSAVSCPQPSWAQPRVVQQNHPSHDDDEESRHKRTLLQKCDEQLQYLNRQVMELRLLRIQIEKKECMETMKTHSQVERNQINGDHDTKQDEHDASILFSDKPSSSVQPQQRQKNCDSADEYSHQKPLLRTQREQQIKYLNRPALEIGLGESKELAEKGTVRLNSQSPSEEDVECCNSKQPERHNVVVHNPQPLSAQQQIVRQNHRSDGKDDDSEQRQLLFSQCEEQIKQLRLLQQQLLYCEGTTKPAMIGTSLTKFAAAVGCHAVNNAKLDVAIVSPTLKPQREQQNRHSYDKDESEQNDLLLARCNEQLQHLNRQTLELRLLQQQLEEKEQTTTPTMKTSLKSPPKQPVVECHDFSRTEHDATVPSYSQVSIGHQREQQPDLHEKDDTVPQNLIFLSHCDEQIKQQQQQLLMHNNRTTTSTNSIEKSSPNQVAHSLPPFESKQPAIERLLCSQRPSHIGDEDSVPGDVKCVNQNHSPDVPQQKHEQQRNCHSKETDDDENYYQTLLLLTQYDKQMKQLSHQTLELQMVQHQLDQERQKLLEQQQRRGQQQLQQQQQIVTNRMIQRNMSTSSTNCYPITPISEIVFVVLDPNSTIQNNNNRNTMMQSTTPDTISSSSHLEK
jgi:hypothetical protein